MKLKKITLIALLLINLFSCKQEKIVELPLTAQIGYDHFSVGFGGLTPVSDRNENDPWINTFPEISKFPEGLTDMKYGFIETNIHQSVYQNYFLGNITKDWYENLQKSWNWIPDTLNLTRTSLKTKIAFVFGKNSEDIIQIAVDANNNLDLSDDKIFTPLEIYTIDRSKSDSLIQAYAVNVSFETFVQSKVAPVRVPLIIMYHAQINRFMCNFSQYLTTRYRGIDMVVSSGFTDLSYSTIEIAFKRNDLNPGERYPEEEIYRKNEYIEIKDEIYKILGVSTNKNTLNLEKTGLTKTELYSTQIGYKSYPFQGEEFTKETTISLDQHKGKYILLDFWATWCGPCIQEFPNLRELYAKADTTKFEIIGIIGDSPLNTIPDAIDKYEITWPQILSDDTNKIKEQYGISGYPTTILIDKRGVIIAKNLRGKELEEKILSLIAEENTSR